MCGIVGWINNKKILLNKENIFKEMTESLKHRGKDSIGYSLNNNSLLGHTRLAIIDVKKGIQPMSCDGYTLIYNGELYNTLEVREILLEKGFTFKTTSDTEVILKGFICFKEKILDYLNGIFSFAIKYNNKLFIARDRLGVKPLYYYHKNNDFIFASEIKSLLKSKIVKPIINKKSLLELLSIGPSHLIGSGIYKDIYELKPGHYLTYNKNKLKIKKYWDVKNKKNKDTLLLTLLSKCLQVLVFHQH